MAVSEQFRAFIQPGSGFNRWGFWAPADLFADASLWGSLVIFIAGFNDRSAQGTWDPVYQAIDEHVDWYKRQGCALAFVEVDDHHGHTRPCVATHGHTWPHTRPHTAAHGHA